MMTAEYVLELNNVFHSGQVEPGTCLQKLIGSVRTGVILKASILTCCHTNIFHSHQIYFFFIYKIYYSNIFSN